MRDIVREIDESKLLIKVSNKVYENNAVLNASFKYGKDCFIHIESIGSFYEIMFEIKNIDVNLKMIANNFENEIIDHQIRINTEREYKTIREDIIKKAFSSIQ